MSRLRRTHPSRREVLQALSGVVGLLIAACAPAAPPAPSKPAAEPRPEGTRPAEKPAEKPAAAPAKPTPTAQPPVAYTSGTKVVMRVHWSGAFFNDLQKVINEYNSGQGQQDKVYVDLQRILAQGIPAWMTTFIADFQAGTSEDVYHLYTSAMFPDLVDRGLFSAPPAEIEGYIKENYFPGPVADCTSKGKIYGYPTEAQPSVMFLTKELWQKAGLDAAKEFPKNWDEWRQRSKQLTRTEGSKKVQVGYTWQDVVDWRHFKDRVFLHWSGGEEFIESDSHKVNLGSDVGRKITELYYNMAVTDGSTSAGLGTMNDSYDKKLSSMLVMDSWTVRFWLRDEGGEAFMNDQLTVPIPPMQGGKKGTVGHHYALLVGSKSKAKDESWKFLRWFDEKPDIRMQKFQTDVFGFAPSHKGYKLPDFFPEQMKKAFEEVMPNSAFYPQVRGTTAISETLMKNQQDLAFGKLKPDEFTKKTTDELNKVIQDAYAS
jgi:ABC-type glycerol-3-phosphate transport system substrate-binding protein